MQTGSHDAKTAFDRPVYMVS